MAVPRDVQRLLAYYRDNRAEMQAASYNEATARSELIDPLFRALGWDVGNRAHRVGNAREVFRETAQRIPGLPSRAPDYLFRTGGADRFYLEAKKPHVNIKTDKESAFQIRRYGWSTRLSVGVLTDFAELAVYDCRPQPSPTDNAARARLRYIREDEYEDQWPWLVEYLSRDAVASGSLDRLVVAEGGSAGQSVDTAFLGELRLWRSALAEDLARTNRGLSADELNFAVQSLLDRLVFLRICETRGLEAPGDLLGVLGAPHVYDRLMELFRRADSRYNSGLFHFTTETGQHETPDLLSPALKVSDTVLRPIVQRLAGPSEYEFSAIPADILGQAYEQFLGQVIVLDGQHRATVETKPEVRKSGGVYYTPAYVVEHLVATALDPVLKGLTVADAAKVRVLDPACGSGTFLLAAYQHLLDWHLQRHLTGDPKRRKRVLTDIGGGVWRLSTAERRRILTNSIFGVDVDQQAVEVTKLSLLLKVIEGEAQMEINVGRLLPDLGDNVRCGDSVIGPDIDDVLPDLDPVARARIRPFDWVHAFPAAHAAGGFDAVVGNPPYLSVDDTWGARDPRLAYLKAVYPDVHTDKTDLLFYFLHKAVSLSRGETAVIVSRAFLEAAKARKLRAWLGANTRVRSVTDLRQAHVFPKVGITTALVSTTAAPRPGKARFRKLVARSLPAGATAATLTDPALFTEVTVDQRRIGAAPWTFADTDVTALLAKIDAAGQPAKEVLHVGQGMQTGANRVFEGPPEGVQKAALRVDALYRRARNSDIGAYRIRNDGPPILYPNAVADEGDLPAPVLAHLEASRAVLTARAAYRRGNCRWWQYTWPLHKEHARRPRILSPYLAPANRFALVSCALNS